ncbi:branched-chain amino acid ABC transporter permease, partial [Geobacillus zalihae]
LTIVSTFLQNYPETRMIIYSIVLILVMLYRPTGLMGTKELSSLFKWRKAAQGGMNHGGKNTVA